LDVVFKVHTESPPKKKFVPFSWVQPFVEPQASGSTQKTKFGLSRLNPNVGKTHGGAFGTIWARFKNLSSSGSTPQFSYSFSFPIFEPAQTKFFQQFIKKKQFRWTTSTRLWGNNRV